MTKDLSISQAQLEEALSDQGVVTPSGRTTAQLAAGIWHTLRKTETEGLLKAARDSYEKKQWQRAADHYAALDSELGEGAPLPGIWGRNDPYEGYAKSMGTAKPLANMPAPHIHAYPDGENLQDSVEGLRRHLADVHHRINLTPMGIGSMREIHVRSHRRMENMAAPAEPPPYPESCGNDEPHESHDYSPGGTTFQTVRFCRGIPAAAEPAPDPAGPGPAPWSRPQGPENETMTTGRPAVYLLTLSQYSARVAESQLGGLVEIGGGRAMAPVAGLDAITEDEAAPIRAALARRGPLYHAGGPRPRLQEEATEHEH